VLRYPFGELDGDVILEAARDNVGYSLGDFGPRGSSDDIKERMKNPFYKEFPENKKLLKRFLEMDHRYGVAHPWTPCCAASISGLELSYPELPARRAVSCMTIFRMLTQ
jgi:hypothetical protein